MIRRRAVVTGRVQGVGFRWATRAEARMLGLAGWVRNRRDGAVELEAEGPSSAVDRLFEWLRHGPPGADVAGLHAEPLPPTAEAGGFEILADD